MGYQKKGYTSGEIGVAWLQDWDKLTKQKANGRHRLLIVDGHSSHYTLAFLDYVLQSDYNTYADTSDCLVFFLSNSFHRSPCTIRSDELPMAFHVRYDLEASIALLCTISISEPHILRYLVLGELRSISP